MNATATPSVPFRSLRCFSLPFSPLHAWKALASGLLVFRDRVDGKPYSSEF
jgi:hypothetical protein